MENKELALTDIILFLWQKKVLLGITTVLCAIIVYTIASFQEKQYEVTTKIISHAGSNKIGDIAQLAAVAGISLGSGDKSDISQYLPELVTDREFLKKLVWKKWPTKTDDSITLFTLYGIVVDTSKKDWKGFYEQIASGILRGKGIELIADSKTGILTLSTVAKDPVSAYAINLETIFLLDEYIKNNMKSQAREQRLFISQRLSEVKEQLAVSENDLVRFRMNNVSSSSPRLQQEEQRLVRQVTINQEIYLQYVKQFELARVQELNDVPILEIIKHPEVPFNSSNISKKVMAVVGGFAGFFIGILISLGIIGYYKIKENIKETK
jgi:uncharacterized protein involved in exopolysaccharide biosynthesis